MVQGEDKLKGSAQANLEHNRQSLKEKIDRFRSGGEHSRTGGEHSPVIGHSHGGQIFDGYGQVHVNRSQS